MLAPTFNIRPYEEVFLKLKQAIVDYKRSCSSFNFQSFLAHCIKGEDNRTGIERANQLLAALTTQRQLFLDEGLAEDKRMDRLVLTIKEFDYGSELMDRLTHIVIEAYKLERLVQRCAIKHSQQLWNCSPSSPDYADLREDILLDAKHPTTQKTARRIVLTSKLATLANPMHAAPELATEEDEDNPFACGSKF